MPMYKASLIGPGGELDYVAAANLTKLNTKLAERLPEWILASGDTIQISRTQDAVMDEKP